MIATSTSATWKKASAARDPQVTGAGQVDAGADAAAVDRGDYRRPRRLDRAEGVLQPFDVAQPRFGGAARIRARRELARRIFEVETSGEMLALATEQDRPNGGIAADRAEGVADGGEHVMVHRVELAGAGELDLGDALVDPYLDPVASHWPPSMISTRT